MKEIWKSIEGYEQIYQVSNLGRVKSFYGENEKFLKVSKATKGKYANVSLWKLGKQKSHSVHRLVAAHFIPNPNNLPEVNHIDTDKANNSEINLEWCTRIENHHHAMRNGLIVGTKGEKNSLSILTESDVLEIRELYKTGKYVFAELARMFSVSHNCVSYAIKRKTWTHI